MLCFYGLWEFLFQFSVEVLGLVKRTLPVASAAAQFASKVIRPVDSFSIGPDSMDSVSVDANAAGPDAVSSGPSNATNSAGSDACSAYSDTSLTHYATVETEHPYKQSSVSHFRVSMRIVEGGRGGGGGSGGLLRQPLQRNECSPAVTQVVGR